MKNRIEIIMIGIMSIFVLTLFFYMIEISIEGYITKSNTSRPKDIGSWKVLPLQEEITSNVLSTCPIVGRYIRIENQWYIFITQEQEQQDYQKIAAIQIDKCSLL